MTEQSTIARLENEWRTLLDRWLPEAPVESPWRFRRGNRPDDPEQGWKLHVSATILSACEALAAIAPIITPTGLQMKAPVSLTELKKLNCGLFYGFSQVGKCFSVYVPTAEQALELSARLDAATRFIVHPEIPYEDPVSVGSAVFVRFGSFSLMRETPTGAEAALRTPDGSLVPDVREPGRAVPPWIQSPFPIHPVAVDSPLRSVRAYEILSQRGKGGVYRAIDVRRSPAVRCVLKEGRVSGEMEWDGRDGRWRLEHELAVLSQLAAVGVPVPKTLDRFEAAGSSYAVLEDLRGEPLQHLLLLGDRISVDRAVRIGTRIAEILADVHAAGWAWRDLKPWNLIIDADDGVRPIDFEGATRAGSPDPAPWGTTGYLPPEWPARGEPVQQDLFALGATLHQLFEGLPAPPNEFLDEGRLASFPHLRAIVERLQNVDARTRPPAERVVESLQDTAQPHRHAAKS